jgi:hypothetical protein
MTLPPGVRIEGPLYPHLTGSLVTTDDVSCPSGYEQLVMAWALALVVVIGVGLPMAAWSITRRLPPSRRAANRLGAGYDSIDRWLRDQYQLPPHERWRVREAVFEGRQVSDAALVQATHGLAAWVLAGGFRTLRLSPALGWVNAVIAIGFTVTGIVLLVTSRHTEGLALGILGLVNCGLFMFAGVGWALSAKQVRHNATQALWLNANDE